MLNVLTADQSASADRYTIEKGLPSLVLMERAALSIVKIIEENELDPSAALILCGTGNNAADGVAVARLLCEKGWLPSICLLGNKEKYSHDLNRQLEIIREYPVCFADEFDPEDYTLILDGMFGIGLKRPVSGIYETVIRTVNECSVPVIAIDIPSGLNADNGIVEGCAVCADITVTFQYAKVGQLTGNGPGLCGDLYVENIGIMPVTEDPKCCVLTGEDLDLLPGRDESGNKGTFGKLLVVAGSKEICGAAYLCAAAAMKCGIGMVRIFTSEINRAPVCSLLPEALITTYGENTQDLDKLDDALDWADCVLCGPGIGTDDFSAELLKRLLKKNPHPIVLDADALNILSVKEELWELIHYPCTVTPHAGEMSRLTQKSVSEIKADPLGAAMDLAEKRNVVCVLKDSVTVTAYPQGQIVINTTGSSALATAGTGDVLAGMIAGYYTRYRNEDLPLAAFAVYEHGAAGESAEAILGADAVTATDLLIHI